MRIDSMCIETILAEKNLTRGQLATACGISRQNLSTIIQRGSCTPRTCGKIARGLGVSVTDIAPNPTGVTAMR